MTFFEEKARFLAQKNDLKRLFIEVLRKKLFDTSKVSKKSYIFAVQKFIEQNIKNRKQK